MPRTKKPAGQAVDRRNGRRSELAAGPARLEYFPCPLSRPSRAAADAWELVWADPVHEAWTPADGLILDRWMRHWDREARAARRADRHPTVEGGNGQLTEHPSYQTATRATATIEKCEQLLGLGALNRVKLGLSIAQERKSLLDLNAELAGGAGDDDDPR
jgi:hypothetical protein